MIEYIYKDMLSMVRYLPYSLAVGLPAAVVCLLAARLWRGKEGGVKGKYVPVAVFAVYLTVMLTITFLSRESGTRRGIMDLELFSTWGINDRNNAFVVENILLFIPYGFACPWVFRRARNLFCCTLIGAVTSLGIESLQLLTRRGYFQIDDILTNTLGTILGFLIYWLWRGVCRIFRGTPAEDKREDL
ncbi:MAG: VanZ family protein [Lachnospiraceae bacterium]|jgi:glycopeptide antibiotics resistance protein|nr:VanZ family protein [Lachnospiraceae bacterium]